MAPPSHHFTFAAASSHVHGELARSPFAGAALVRSFLAAGAPPRRGTLALTAVPVGASKGGRRAVAVASAAAAPGAGDDDDDLPSDSEGLVSTFRFEMQVFKMNQRPVALLGEGETMELLNGALGNARDCMPMMEFLIGKEAVDGDTFKELVSAGQAVLVVEGQSNEGYVRADALANAIEGLKLVGRVFFDGADLPRYTTPVVPLSGDDVDKNSYFRELINLFVVYYTALQWEAYYKYDYNPRASN